MGDWLKPPSPIKKTLGCLKVPNHSGKQMLPLLRLVAVVSFIKRILKEPDHCNILLLRTTYSPQETYHDDGQKTG